jgi:short-subunit dehydrogenase/acyl dehydratase/acyl carrier protein
MTTLTTFSDINVGDLAVFQQSYSTNDFDNFSAMSGDTNPLHHDVAYAALSEFDRPIVPMHITIAPFSRIAGMIFPGDPSLYLSHEVRSIMPVFYGDSLTYSARVVSINEALRTLTLRVLVLRGHEVVLDAQMQVMSRLDKWMPKEGQLDFSPEQPVALITGATGEIGSALALDMARRGSNLVLVDRGESPKRAALREALVPIMSPTQTCEFVTADLVKPVDVDALCSMLESKGNVTSLFHSASPALTASLEDLVQVNYAALQKISQSMLPAMLTYQKGVVANIGSVSTERVIPGWHDYSATKAMASQFIGNFDRSHSEFGVRGLTVLSGLVATKYSASVQGGSPAMVPQELAESVLKSALDDRSGKAVLIEWNGKRAGSYGFHDDRAATPLIIPTQITATPTQSTEESAALDTDLVNTISTVLRNRLGLAASADITSGGVGSTPGWDSLRHIELVLELEQVFGIRYGASEIEKMFTFSGVVDVTKAKLNSAT